MTAELLIAKLTQRLDHLERQNRGLKRAVVVVGLAVFGMFIAGAAMNAPQEIRAKRVVVLDERSKPRIVLGKAKDEEKFGVTLLRPEGQVAGELFERELVGGMALQSVLILNDLRGDPHIHLITYSDSNFDRAKLSLLGQYQLVPQTGGMETSPENIELQVISDRDPAHRQSGIKPSSASLGLRTNRIGAGFWLDGEDASLSFNSYEALPPAGVLASKKGSVSIGLGNDGPTLTLTDSLFGPQLVAGQTSLKTRTGVVEQLPASSLVLFDKDGKVIWKAP